MRAPGRRLVPGLYRKAGERREARGREQACMWRRHSCLRAARSDAVSSYPNGEGHGHPVPFDVSIIRPPSAARRQECLRHIRTRRSQTQLSDLRFASSSPPASRLSPSTFRTPSAASSRGSRRGTTTGRRSLRSFWRAACRCRGRHASRCGSARARSRPARPGARRHT